jgi:proton-translocating NADH-quinone oxidoreductase chain L
MDIFSNPVQYAWIVAALPLAAMIVNFFGFRMLDVLTRPKEAVAQADPHAAHGDAHSSAPEAADAHVEESHGGHDDEHGASTGFWASVVSWVALGAMVLAFLYSCLIGFQFLGWFGYPSGETALHDLQSKGVTLHIYNWFNFGKLNYPIDFHVDALTVVMLVVVTAVSMLVHLYSMGYMAGDRGYSRFFIELSLFTFSMLLLVLGANFLVLFIGWELVGLSSYLLIGYFFSQAQPPVDSEVPWAPPAQLKAFVTTRFGDFGFLIGILLLWVTTGTFNFTDLNFNTKTSATGLTVVLATTAMILVFCGAVGKSAQFPLHVWLPDAMAGPTPVSALIHAATMVAAGVYLVARLFPLYATVAGPESLQVVGYVGAFTAIFAATIALTQTDIKGVLAYSTISQLGYMFAGLAVAENNTVGIFHLFTHAFFKALLFLGAGSVIHALHENGIGAQNLRNMGGLARWLPITAFTMLMANLAISGIPPFSGFFSKDLILATAYERGYLPIYYILLFTAFLTAFYMFRLYFLAFGGRGGAVGGLWGGEYRGVGEPHESPWVMTVPLILLAIPTVVAGFLSYNNAFANFLTGGEITTPYVSPFAEPLTYVSIGVAAVGILLAWAMYGLRVIPANLFSGNPVGAPIYQLLKHRYYIDELYAFIIKYVVLGLSQGAYLFDTYIIDGLVNGTGRFVRGLGSVTRRSESGFLQNYGAVLFGGALLLMIAVFFAVGVFR